MGVIPFILLLILAVPVAVIVALIRLWSKLTTATEQIEFLRRRLDQLELEQRQRPVAVTSAEPAPPEAPEPTAPEAVPPLPPLDVTPAVPPLVLEAIAPVGAVSYQTAESQPELVPQAANAAAPPLVSATQAPPAFKGNWEQFMGVKLFAWIGGLALFLGIAFFVKYSFDRNLIPPEVRVAIGFLAGLGLLVGGVLLKRRELAVTSQTLSATGVVVLYAVTFACRSIYHFPFFGPVATFLLMALVTVAAFSLAVQLDALVVAVLGILGGFLTPILLSTGQDNPLGLFTYIALLDLGLLAVAFNRRWDFLILLGAIGTALMQLGWVMHFFAPEKVWVAMAVFLGFSFLFLGAFAAGETLQKPSPWLNASAVGLPFVAMVFVFYLLSFQSLAVRPGVVFGFLFGADLCLLAVAWLRTALHPVHLAAGTVCFLALAVWTAEHVTAGLLNWALGLYLLFAIVHALFPVALGQARAVVRQSWWGHLFPPVALLLVLIPILGQQTVSLWIWPTVLLIDLLAIGLAVLTLSLASVVLTLVITLGLAAVWLFRIPAELTGLPPLLAVIGGFAAFFFIMGIWLRKRLESATEEGAPSEMDRAIVAFFGDDMTSVRLGQQIPALSAILPFLLLILVSTRMPLFNPSPVFGLAALLLALLIGLALFGEVDLLIPVGLACVLALEHTWHQEHFNPGSAFVPLAWYLGFYAAFTAVPFAFRERAKGRLLIWACAALAGPAHFFLIYQAVSLGWPNPYLGVLPALMSLPMLAALAYVVRGFAPDSGQRLNLLAWFGGSALFFITLIFPIQLERQWITIGWGLEGLALIWLFQRVPHPGLRATGVVLLITAFVRLALNPAVLDYHRSSTTRVFNWYLYAFGLVTVCLFLSAQLLAPPRHLVWHRNVRPALYTLGTVLAFLLVNIEIADYFAEGSTLTFQFSGNFARDMTYSMAWALFALVLLIVGIWKGLAAVRYAALGLLSVTLLKLFLHDLSELGQLYRIGAFMVVAVILILASFLYQRFVSFEAQAGPAKLKA